MATEFNRGDKFIGETLYEIRKMTPKQDARVAAIFRGDRAIKPTRETEIEPLDEVFYVAAKNNILPVMLHGLKKRVTLAICLSCWISTVWWYLHSRVKC